MQGEPKVNRQPSQTRSLAMIQALNCVGFLQETLKSLAEGGVRFLFPVIRQALRIRLGTKATLTAAHVPSPEGETHSDSEGCVKPGIPLALEK